MATPQLPCPACHSAVFFPQGARPGDSARCPLCEATFKVEKLLVPQQVPTRDSGNRAPLLVAAAATLFLGCVLMVVVSLRIRATTPVEENLPDQNAQETIAEAVVPDPALERLLREGKDALAKGQNDIALARFREHARLSHVPTEIVDGILTAATGLEKARGAAEWARQNNQIAKKGAEDRRRAFEQALEMARKDMVADNLVGARGALERATLLDPDNPDLKKDYDDLLKRERAGTSRESAMVRLRTGQTHLTADRWGEALRDFETVLAIIPDNAEARAGQQKAIAGLKSLEELEEKRLQYLVQLDDGRKALRDRRFDDAEASFQRAAKIMRDEKEPQRLLDQVRTDRRELDNTVSMIIRSAQAFLAQNKPSEAFYRLLDADFLSPRNPQVRRLMADAQQRMALTKNMNNPFISDPKYQNWMAQGRMALTQGNPFMAMEAFQNALAQSNNSDPFARQAFFEARRQSDSLGQKAQEFQKVFSDAKILYTAKRYSQALPLLENAMTMFPGEVRVAEMLEECRYQDLIEKARSALSRDPAETERLADLALRMRPAEVTPRNLIKQARAIRFAKVPEPRFPVQ